MELKRKAVIVTALLARLTGGTTVGVVAIARDRAYQSAVDDVEAAFEEAKSNSETAKRRADATPRVAAKTLQAYLRQVCRSPSERAEIDWYHPAQLVVLGARRRVVRGPGDSVSGEVNVDFADTGDGAVDRFADDDVDTELFVELSLQGI